MGLVIEPVAVVVDMSFAGFVLPVVLAVGSVVGLVVGSPV